MKAYDILEALGEIDDTLLAACEDYTAARAARRKTWMRTAAGVCAVLLLAVGIRVLPALQRVSSDTAASEMDSATEIMQTEAAVENENDSPLYSGADNAGGIIPPVGSSPSDALRDEIAQEPPLKNTEATPLPEEAEDESPVVEAPAVDEAPAEVPAEDDVEITVSTAEKVETEADTDAQLPMLSVGFADGGYGFEGILLYEDDIRCNDPLLDVYGTPEALPVYENLAYSDMSGTPVYLSDDAMLRMGLDCAEMLGFAVLSQETTYRGDDVDIDGDIVRLETDGGEIEVQGDGLITIRLDRAVILPDGLALGDDTDIETAEESIVYLTRHFGMLLADAEYQPVITLSRSFDGEAHRTFSAYPIGETAADSYLNKSCASVMFYCGEDENTVDMIRIENRLLSARTLGDYPLISKDEATQRLLDGYFITTVPSEYYDENGITEDAILFCELTYHTGNLDAYFLPYYHFYVQIEDAYNQAEGLNRYGGFWVPAVHPDYLDPETVRDSRFN